MTTHLYILKQILVALAFAVAALLLVALPGVLVSTVHKMPGVDLVILLRFLPLVLQALTPYMLPICFALSIVAVFGRMAADHEWTALQLTGRHPLKLLAVPSIVALALGIGTFWILSSELPQLRKRQKVLLLLAANSLVENLQPGKTSIDLAGFHLIAASRDMDTGTFYRVYFRYDEGDAQLGERIDVFAREAKLVLKGEILTLHALGVEAFDVDTGSFSRLDRLDVDVDIGRHVQRQAANYERARYLTTRELNRRLRAGDAAPRRLREYRYTIHYRAALSAVYIVFAGLGAATGLLMRRSSQLSAMVVAVGYGIVYYIFNMEIGEELGMNPSLPPWVGAWATNALGLGVAALLLRRAFRR